MPDPRRIRLSRSAGWRIADHSTNYRLVSRPGRFGNPFDLAWVRLAHPDASDHDARIVAVQTFHRWLTDDTFAATLPTLLERRAWILAHLDDLVGRDLACWCPLPDAGQVDWCHGAVLLGLSVGAGGAR